MLESWVGPVRGVMSFVVLLLNTVFWCSLLFMIALLKLLIPIDGWRIACLRLSNEIVQLWVGVNNFGLKLTKDIDWDVEGLDGLSADRWYLLIANHQSMIDIAVLQSIFHRRTPLLKFFLKQELFWVPILGLAWWALDFPFMKRSSSARQDLETARKACEKFKLAPVTVMNFVEGTRFTAAKKEDQKSPFTHLLKPKVGGISVVLGAMGEQLDSILDVTIAYPQGPQGMWSFLCCKSTQIKVRVKQIPVTSELVGDFLADRDYRRRFLLWLSSLWEEKDKLIDTLLHSSDDKAAYNK